MGGGRSQAQPETTIRPSVFGLGGGGPGSSSKGSSPASIAQANWEFVKQLLQVIHAL